MLLACVLTSAAILSVHGEAPSASPACPSANCDAATQATCYGDTDPETGCQQQSCVTMTTMVGNETCYNSCPMNCGPNEVSCPGGTDPYTGCPVAATCMPKNIESTCPVNCPLYCNVNTHHDCGGYDTNGCWISKCCDGVAPSDAGTACTLANCDAATQLTCYGDIDPETGCQQQSCIPMTTMVGNETCFNSCPIPPCGPHYLSCPGGTNPINGCPIPETCMLKNHPITGCPEHCPVYCDPNTQHHCGETDPETGCFKDKCCNGVASSFYAPSHGDFTPLNDPCPSANCNALTEMTCYGDTDPETNCQQESCVPSTTLVGGVTCYNYCPITCGPGYIICPGGNNEKNGCPIMSECMPAGTPCPGASLPENTAAPTASLPENTAAPTASLPENTAAPIASLPENTAAPIASLPENTAAPTASLPENTAAPTASLPEGGRRQLDFEL